ncbi:MAG TPA: hypothetical protein V6C76_10110 [Drouetiella sp.]
MAEKDMRLGEMLQALGIVSREQLNEAIRMAGEVALPLGRALVLYGYLSQDQLNLSLELQSLVKNKGLPLPTAITAYKHVRNSRVDLGTALLAAGYTGAQASISGSRLGTLLLDSSLITQEQLDLAQRAGYETGQPIGRMLVLMGVLSQETVNVALDAQKAFREERISYSQALKTINPNPQQAQANKALSTSNADPTGMKQIRLGELLMLSGLLTEADILNALEYGITKQKPFGQILIDLGLLNQSVLELALNLQKLVCEGTLELSSATDTLYSYAVTGRTQAEKLSVEGNTIRLGELLKLSGLVDDNDIQHAISLSTKYPSVIGKMLVLAGTISEATLLAALRCQFLLRHKVITTTQAVDALRHAENHRISVDDSFDDLGFQIPLHPSQKQ